MAKLGVIREIKVSMETEDHARSLNTLSDPSRQASVHASSAFVCTGSYLGHIWSDQIYQGTYGIREYTRVV